MNTDRKTDALYQKMASEQDKYRNWLMSQPPEEILQHTYEYTVRQDILIAMEQTSLTAEQEKALMASPDALADIYRYFSKLDTDYMDTLRDSIINRADDFIRLQSEQ